MPKKVLVVDKDPSVQAFFEKTLGPDKFTLSGINDGVSALDMLDKIKPDMILVEHALYGMDIFRFCEKVKQKNKDKERPVIVITAPEDQFDAGRLMSLGVMAILKKPLDPKLLLEKILELSEDTATVIDRQPAASPGQPPVPAPKTSAPTAPAASGEGSMKIEEMLGWSLPSDKAEDSVTTKMPTPPSPKADLEQTVVLPRGGEAIPSGTPSSAPGSAPAAAPAADLEQTVVVPQGGIPEGPGNISPAKPTSPAPAAPVESQNEALLSPLSEDKVAEIIRAAAQQIIERVAWDVIPGAADAEMKNLPPVTAESLLPQADHKPADTPAPEIDLKAAEPLVREMAKEIIAKVAWEVAGTGSPAPGGPGNAGSPSQGGAGQVVDQLAREIIEKVAWDVVPALAEDIIKKELARVKAKP